MKIQNTPTPQPKVETPPKQAAPQAAQKVQAQEKPQAPPQNPAHLGKSVDTKA